MSMTDLERLAAYDRMYGDLLREQEGVLAKLEALRSAGKQRGATYQQLLAQKLTLQNLIGRFEVYGINPESSQKGGPRRGRPFGMEKIFPR